MSEDTKGILYAILILMIILTLGGLAVQGVCLLFGAAPLGLLHSIGIFVAIVIFLAFITK